MRVGSRVLWIGGLSLLSVLILIAGIIFFTNSSSASPLKASPAPTEPTVPIAVVATTSVTTLEAGYTALKCPHTGVPTAKNEGSSTDDLATCGTDGTKYMLGQPLVFGTYLATVGVEPEISGSGSNATSDGYYEVNLTYTTQGASYLNEATTFLYQQFTSGKGTGAYAITLNGIVEWSSIVNNGAITNGIITISNSFTQLQARNLATAILAAQGSLYFRSVFLSQSPY
jgi:preprotein translocase subunit SecD